MSDKVSEVTKDSFVALAVDGGGGIRATSRSLPLTAQGATAGVLGCENITLARWYSPEYEYVSTKICYLF